MMIHLQLGVAACCSMPAMTCLTELPALPQGWALVPAFHGPPPRPIMLPDSHAACSRSGCLQRRCHQSAVLEHTSPASQDCLPQGWALYCLILMFLATREELAPIRPLPKFIVVKIIVFASFWQSVAIAILVSTGVIRPSVRCSSPPDGPWLPLSGFTP